MALQQRVAVVTGANKGIGFAIAKALGRQPGFHVILGCRNAERGQSAVDSLKAEGLPVELQVVDVASEQSMRDFARRVLDKHGRVDVLVNNAAVAGDLSQEERDAALKAGERERARPSFLEVKPERVLRTFEVNTVGPLVLCQEFVPSMIKNNYGRIVNVSSGAGQLSDMNGRSPAYRFSKVALNALTRIVNDEMKDKNILVNSMCPGFVKTDMTGGEASPAKKTPDQAADTAVWLATLPDDGPRGGFFRDRQPIPW